MVLLLREKLVVALRLSLELLLANRPDLVLPAAQPFSKYVATMEKDVTMQ